MEPFQFDLFLHAFKEVEDALVCKVPGMLAAGFIKYLLFNINVVAPVPSLEKGSLIKTGPERTGEECYHYEGQQYAPSKSLEAKTNMMENM